MAQVSGRRRRPSRSEVLWETHPQLRLLAESIHEVLVLWPLRAIRFIGRRIREEFRQNGLIWVVLPVVGMLMATLASLAVQQGWVEAYPNYVSVTALLPFASFLFLRVTTGTHRWLYDHSDSYQYSVDRLWGWVTSRPRAIWGFITSRWARTTLFVLLIAAGVFAVRHWEIRYALWPVVVLGPSAIASVLLKGWREKKDVRWTVSRVFPWAAYPIFVFLYSAESVWAAIEPTLDRWASETWLVWPLSFAFGVVLTLGIRIWNRIASDHKLAWYHGLWIVPLSSALMRWVGFELVLYQVDLARVLSGAAAVWAVLAVLFWRWLVFSRLWTDNPLRSMGLVNQEGEVLVNESMPYIEFTLPVSRILAPILQLAFHIHPEADRTEYLSLLDPTAGLKGVVRVALGLQYLRGETIDTFADPERVKDSVAISTTSKVPLSWWGYVFQNAMRKQLPNPSKDSFPTPLARWLDIAHVRFQDADLGPDIVKHVPIRGVGKMWIVKKGPKVDGKQTWFRYDGEDAWSRIWLAMYKAGRDIDNMANTFRQAADRAKWAREHPEARGAGRQRVEWRGDRR